MSLVKQVSVRGGLVIVVLLGASQLACTGDVGPAGQASAVPAGGSLGAGGPSPAGGSATTAGQGGQGPVDPALPLWSGSVGSWCGPADSPTNWLVFRPGTSTCQTDANSIYGQDAALNEPGEVIVVQLTGQPTPAVPQVLAAKRCRGTTCVDASIELTVQSYAAGAGLSGKAVLDPAGLALPVNVNANPCTFDEHLPAHPEGNRLARDIALTEIAFYQAVKVPIMLNMSEVEDRNADLVQGREALVRVFVEPQPEFQDREIMGRLTIENEGMDPIVLDQTQQVSGASSDQELDSTINFKLEKTALTTSSRYSVELRETAACTELVGTPVAARFPELESLELAARATGTVKVLLVPIRFDGDGSGRMPDTSEEQIERFRALMYATYPTPEVQISVREPVGTTQDSFSRVLGQMIDLRDDDDPPDDLNYYGMLNPADTFREYCGRGCVVGIATFGSQNGVATSGLGVGYPSDTAAETFVHEIGHVHRRPHSPCGGASGADPQYPYDDAQIGSWGWDLRDDSLLDPDSDVTDYMGYCNPTWTSDFTYQRLVDRIALVNERAQNRTYVVETAWRTVFVDNAGAASWGLPVTLRDVPAGDMESALVFDTLGNLVSEIQVYRSELHDTGGALISVPEPEPGWATLKLSGSAPLSFAEPSAVPPFTR